MGILKEYINQTKESDLASMYVWFIETLAAFRYNPSAVKPLPCEVNALTLYKLLDLCNIPTSDIERCLNSEQCSSKKTERKKEKNQKKERKSIYNSYNSLNNILRIFYEYLLYRNDQKIAKNEAKKQQFNDLWEIYNKKIGKKAAFTAFCKIPDTELLNVLEGAKLYTKQVNKDYQCHLSSWLNGERWKDELPKQHEVSTWNVGKLGYINYNGKRILVEKISSDTVLVGDRRVRIAELST